MRRLGSLVLVVVLVLLVNAYPAEIGEAATQETPKPNIVFILTDDQDAISVASMATVHRELVQKGTTFENGILTLPRCCPSRATMLRGQYAHNHGIGGDGGASDFRRRDLDESTVATWLEAASYRTALVGKYLNGYDSLYVPPGWGRWFANLNGDVWATCVNQNGKKVCRENRHPDAVLAEDAVRFVRAREDNPAPLFLWLSFNAPHNPAHYMNVDAEMFVDAPLPRPPSFDEENVSDKPAWVRERPPFTPEQIADMEALHRDRLRSLQMVDRAVGRLVETLADTGRLENTYIFFWTDNGYHMGQHRLLPSKDTPYVEDTQFPLIVRGPGVPEGHRSQEMVLNTDLAPTFVDLAGTLAPDFVDGRSFAPLLRGESPAWRTAALLEGPTAPKLNRPAYAGVRTANRTYVEYENGERELYELSTDAYQLENLLAPDASGNANNLPERLEALRNCAGDSCREAEGGP